MSVTSLLAFCLRVCFKVKGSQCWMQTTESCIYVEKLKHQHRWAYFWLTSKVAEWKSNQRIIYKSNIFKRNLAGKRQAQKLAR